MPQDGEKKKSVKSLLKSHFDVMNKTYGEAFKYDEMCA